MPETISANTTPRPARPRAALLIIVGLGLSALLAWSLSRRAGEPSEAGPRPTPVVPAAAVPEAPEAPEAPEPKVEAPREDAALLAEALERFTEREAALQEEIRTIREIAARLGWKSGAEAPAPAMRPAMAEMELAEAAAPAEPTPEEEEREKPGVFINSLGMRFVPVPSARVRFAIWPVRVRDFAAFAESTGHASGLWKNPGFEQGADHPVVNVSWEEATAFCRWLTEREREERLIGRKQVYRLPSDLEWSRAVGLAQERGATPEARDLGIADVYPWGRQWPPPPGAGNYTGEETGSEEAIPGYRDGFVWTSPVGSFSPNAYGLYDMGGNVWQWCLDLWNAESSARVLRGGSWYNGALKLSLLSSCRIHAAPDATSDDHGFRIVLEGE